MIARLGLLCGALAAVCLLAVTSVQASHPRPKSATPIKMPLVPAFAACTAPNRTHGPPLAFGSCSPPAQASSQATVGTPDALGGAANATGHLRLDWLPCIDNCPGDEQDMLIDIRLSDVRCVPTGARCGTANTSGPPDYAGEMRLSFAARLSDHWNALAPGGGTDPATVQDFSLDLPPAAAAPLVCGQSGSTSTGSTCNLITSLNAQIPGASKGGKRSIWALDAVRLYDGGADGDGSTTGDNTVFARPGIFIP